MIRKTFSNFVTKLSTLMTWSTKACTVDCSLSDGTSAIDSGALLSSQPLCDIWWLCINIKFACCSIFCRLAMASHKLCRDSSSLFIADAAVIIKLLLDDTILCECESGMETSSSTFSIIRHGSVSESSISVVSDSISLPMILALLLTLCFAVEAALLMAFITAVMNDWWRCGDNGPSPRAASKCSRFVSPSGLGSSLEIRYASLW